MQPRHIARLHDFNQRKAYNSGAVVQLYRWRCFAWFFSLECHAAALLAFCSVRSRSVCRQSSIWRHSVYGRVHSAQHIAAKSGLHFFSTWLSCSSNLRLSNLCFLFPIRVGFVLFFVLLLFHSSCILSGYVGSCLWRFERSRLEYYSIFVANFPGVEIISNEEWHAT